jgi:hypothetical protein
MRIAMQAEVTCIDGLAGLCRHAIVDTTALQVTHLVVAKPLPKPPEAHPRLVAEKNAREVVLKAPRLRIDEDQAPSPPRPPRLVIEHEEHRATLNLPPHLVVEENTTWPAQPLVPFGRVADATVDEISLACTQEELAAMEDFVQRHYEQESVPDYHNAGELALLHVDVPNEVRTVLVEEQRIPANSAAVSRSTRVEATDGPVGTLNGLVVEPGSGRITHLVLQEGPLPGQKQMAVPAELIDHLDGDVAHLKLDRRAVEAQSAFSIGDY